MHRAVTYLLTVTLAFASLTVRADGWGDLSGTAKAGDTVLVAPCEFDAYGNGGLPVDACFSIYLTKKAMHWPDSKHFFQKCRLDYQAGTFICTGGSSPLANTRYKITANTDSDDCDYEYRYTRVEDHKSPSAPRVMYQNYWECGDN
jgi:hypothetical protein